MPQVASMGAAVAVVDFDATAGRTSTSPTAARDRGTVSTAIAGDGTFEDVAGRLGVADVNGAETGVSMGAVWGDYDNDGYEDLLLYRWGRPGALPQRRGPGVHAGHATRRACPRG